MSRAPAVRQKVVPLVKLHDLLDTKGGIQALVIVYLIHLQRLLSDWDAVLCCAVQSSG